jgi:asparagine synthase (glutamine-hydrolysing)
MYDEPFSDSSQIPTYLVSKLAREKVTVSLSGDGGDEIFAGYVRYQGIDRVWNAVGSVPAAARRGGGAALQMLSPDAWDAMFSAVPARYKPKFLGDKIHKGAAILAEADPDAMYGALVSQWDGEALVNHGQERFLTRPPGDASLASDLPETVARLRYRDMTTYLPDDILTKVDRASMAVALEARVPLLDHRVVEYAWTLPPDRLLNGGQGKKLLRQVLYKYVPQHMVERPKTGFGMPVGDWLRGPLRDWAESLLSEAALKRDGLIDPAPVRLRWQEHLSGRRNWQHSLWTVLMFQAWRTRWNGIATD